MPGREAPSVNAGDSMQHAHSVRPAGSWSGEPADTIVLDYDDRYRRRIAMTGVRGLAFLLDLPEAVMLRAGDGLALEDGRIVEVVAAPEELAEIRGADAAALVRIAWHLGNRHLPTELLKKSLRIRRDHVIEDMARRLGAIVSRSKRRSIPRAAPMSRPRRRTHDRRMATIITNMGMARTIIPITATRITGTATIKTSAPRRMCTGPNAATIITTMASPTTTPTRLMDAQSLKPESLGLGSPRKEDPKLGSFAELPLLLWLSPAFPVGSFAYSHGLEWAVEAGDIVDAATLQRLARRSPAFRRAAIGRDPVRLRLPRRPIRTIGRRWRRSTNWRWRWRARPSGGLRLARKARRFVSAMRAAWACPALDHLPDAGSDPVAYPIAVGAAAAGHRLGLDLSLQAFVLSLIRQFRLGGGAARGDRPDRRAKDAGRPFAGCAATGRGGGRRRARRSRLLRLSLRHRRDPP